MTEALDDEIAGSVARALLDTLPSRTAVVDEHATVIAVNALWRASPPPHPDDDLDLHVGGNVFEVCRRAKGPSAAAAVLFADVLDDVLSGRIDKWEALTDTRTEWRGRWHDTQIVALRRPPGGAVISHSDVADEMRFRLELSHWARYDPLTSLPNRATLMESLDEAVARRRATDGELALVLIDLDDFKVVNDSYGHHVGDQLLRGIADRLRATAGAGRTVTRFIGDTFVMIVEGPEELDIDAIVDDLVALVTEPQHVDGRDVVLTATAGTAQAVSDTTAEGLLKMATAALHRAKARLRGPREQVTTEDDDLRRALADEEFHLVYQPELSLVTGRVVGAEALLRWDHPERGRLAPDQFIERAEESGIIVAIGQWVLRQATRQAAEWPTVVDGSAPLFVAVNLSARQLSDPQLTSMIAAALADAGLPPERLCVEITESAVFDRFDVAVAALADLRAMGVHVALDDFGTGYSSLSYLRRLPVDILKIDRSFIARLTDDARDRVIVEAVVSIARTFGLVVVAEGVENRDQLAVLRRLGCDVAQGYDIGRPGEPDEVVELALSMSRHPTNRGRGLRFIRSR